MKCVNKISLTSQRRFLDREASASTLPNSKNYKPIEKCTPKPTSPTYPPLPSPHHFKAPTSHLNPYTPSPHPTKRKPSHQLPPPPSSPKSPLSNSSLLSSSPTPHSRHALSRYVTISTKSGHSLAGSCCGLSSFPACAFSQVTIEIRSLQVQEEVCLV